MMTVTFSELRNHAKKYFDAVARGESFEVYRNGKPVALLSPVRCNSAPHWKRWDPLVLDGVSLSKAILDERKEGR